MNNQAEVIAFVVFNFLLLVLLMIAWRLLRTKSASVDTDEALAIEGEESTAKQHEVGSSVGSSVESADGVATLPVPASLRGPSDEPGVAPDLSRRRFVPGGVPRNDGAMPDFTLAMNHLFMADNGVMNRKRRATAEPITLSIQAGPRPVTPLLERVVEALTNIGLEPSQTRPLVHSFSDAAGRSARVRLAHSPAHGDLIEIEIEPSISPSAMASVMALLSDLEFDPADISVPAASRQF